jgi:ubiquinone/menaquinone biosynthesis C-methylase UbiE
VSVRFDYSRQALTYDTTRAASPSVLGPVLEALRGAPGPRLLDVGGGTGNYAAALAGHGFEPVVLDASEPMLERARAKGLATLRADASDLPYPDGAFDAVTCISMIHHVPDWRRALTEARRVLAPGGRLALMGWAREYIDEVTWVVDYFPSMREWLEEIHEPLTGYQAALPGARLIRVLYDDAQDMSMSALQRNPALLLDPELPRQTSFFEHLADTAPAELRAGLGRLRVDLAAGRDPRASVEAGRERLGDAFVLAWAKA